ncbi:hypothetical protein [Streptomyces gobiensis]|uniref:hypothetical protein n=1 Tax=Streptomyces gobiensis TaxID=2875706 RepID=UPI001E4C0567|nr:hypothetical protein [Streptomyces gobiensis]UGY94048.1 hypothetical protein test1122_21580 [Streptomyces gobiensis]
MSAEDVLKYMLSWASEDSHRGRLARALQTNMGESAELQARRVGLLSIYVQREAKSGKGLALI